MVDNRRVEKLEFAGNVYFTTARECGTFRANKDVFEVKFDSVFNAWYIPERDSASDSASGES